MPDASAAEKFLVGALHISGKKGGFTAAVGEAKELTGQLLPGDPLLRSFGKQADLPGGSCVFHGDLFTGQLFEKLCAQYRGSRLAAQIKAPETAEAAGGTFGTPGLGSLDLSHVDVKRMVMLAGGTKEKIGLSADSAADGTEHVIVLSAGGRLTVRIVGILQEFPVRLIFDIKIRNVSESSFRGLSQKTIFDFTDNCKTATVITDCCLKDSGVLLSVGSCQR